MGTRGLYGFRMNGIDKTSYNHFDSYPDGLGVTVANFCEATPVEQMKDIYNRIVMVDEQNKPSPELIQKYGGSCDVSVSTQSPEDWYCLLRGLQGELDWMRSVEGDIHMIDNHEFIKDSLFCEYAYIINLDTEEMEFWIGFQHKPDPENRYGQEQDDGYYPCRLYATFPLGEDADAVVAQMKKIEENPEKYESNACSEEERKIIIDAAEALGWTVRFTEVGVCFSNTSPLGEDLQFEYVFTGIPDLAYDLRQRYQDFDVDEHVYLWLEARHHGSWCPSARELVGDADEIEAMLLHLAEAIEALT